MAIESTAINDLISGLQRQPVQHDTNDWLFGEPEADSADADAKRDTSATEPYDRLPPGVIDDYKTVRHPRTTDWGGIAKQAALPVGLFAIVVVLFGVYVAKTETKATAPKTVTITAKAEAIEPTPAAVAPAPLAANKPIVTPIEQPTPEPTAHAVTVEPIAPPVAEPVNPAAETASTEAAAAAIAAVAKADAVAAPANTEPPAPVAEPLNVEPGSPASRFLAPTPAQPTVPTVAAKPAPAPTAVRGLLPPSSVSAPAVAQQHNEKRAAAKRAENAFTAKKARLRQRLLITDAHDDDDVAVKKPAVAGGKGVLDIDSTPAMQVWVDGRNSTAETPVRIILLAGKHKVTLLDQETAKARSFDVEIKRDATTKVVKKY